jgi:diphosphomevalonate decarboxylase
LEGLGQVMERSTFKMHATMHSATPPLMYWRGGTVEALHVVFGLRQAGVGAWATMDAGPQVKVLCLREDADRVQRALQAVAERVEVLLPGGPARLLP